jgi:hypothetical protein
VLLRFLGSRIKIVIEDDTRLRTISGDQRFIYEAYIEHNIRCLGYEEIKCLKIMSGFQRCPTNGVQDNETICGPY